MTDYKFYQFDGTTTYTDQSDYVFDGDKVPVFQVNSDMKPILAGMNIRTKADYSAGWLADGELIAVEKGSTKIFYGYVESSDYDWKSKTWNYNILNLFEQLKYKTCYTDLGANVHSTTFNGRSAYDNLSNIKSGTNDIDWNDLTAKELIEHILEHSDYTGVTQTVTWSVTGDLDTVISNFCVSSLCIKQLGTDYDDEELTSVTVDPEFSVWDLLSELLKAFGLRYYWTGDKAITVYGSPTAISPTDYANADTNNYKERVRKLSEQKRFVLKQNMLVIKDYPTSLQEEDVVRYFSPTYYGLPYFIIDNLEDSGDNCIITTRDPHKIPITSSMFQDMYVRGEGIDQTFEMNEDIVYEDTDELSLQNYSLLQTRYQQTNIGFIQNIESITILNSGGFAYITITITGHGITNETLIVGNFFRALTNTLAAGKYTWETGTGFPTTSGKYHVHDVNTIKAIKSNGLPYTNYTDTGDGTVSEKTGTAGTPKYIVRANQIDQSETFDTSVTQNVSIIEVDTDHLINTATPDTVTISGLGDAFDGKYLYKNRAGGSGSGNPLADNEYWYDVSDTPIYEIYIKAQTDHTAIQKARIKPLFPKYENYANITSIGKEDKNLKLADYLVFYRPDYSTDSDWKEDWFTVDMSITDNTTLLQAALYAPWWLYTFSQDYQTYKNELLTVEDNASAPAISYQTARRIGFNVEDNSAEIEQDKT